jgi:hypothetical protein
MRILDPVFRLRPYPELLEFYRQGTPPSFSFFLSFFLILTSFYLLMHGRCRQLFLQFITLNNTHIGRTPLEEGSIRRYDLHLTTRNTHKKQTSMPPTGFGPAIPATEHPLTHVLNRRSVRSTFVSPISSLSFEYPKSFY